jgi:hypothetical protein
MLAELADTADRMRGWGGSPPSRANTSRVGLQCRQTQVMKVIAYADLRL